LLIKYKICPILIPRILEKYCKNYSDEKYFRFVNITKTVTIFPDGKGLIYTTHEVLNEGKNCIRRFPHRFFTSMATISDSLETLQAQNNFEVRSLDGHDIHWEPVTDDEKRKLVCIIYNDSIRPGDRRKYSIRYEIAGLYKTKRTELGDGEHEGSSFTTRYICDKHILKLKFYPNYRYSNLRYCVESPSKEEIYDKCRDLTAQHDPETGGTFVEVEEINPWRNFSYKVEWIPEN
jgi:hypothetical protein